MLLLAVTIGYGIYWRVRTSGIESRQPSRPCPSVTHRPEQEWPTAISELLAATVLPISLWGLWEFVKALTDFHGPLFMIAGHFC